MTQVASGRGPFQDKGCRHLCRQIDDPSNPPAGTPVCGFGGAGFAVGGCTDVGRNDDVELGSPFAPRPRFGLLAVSSRRLSSFHGPSYEGLDRRHLRMACPVHDVEGATRYCHVGQFHKGSARKFGSDQHVAANRNPLSGNSGFDGVKLFAKVQADLTGKIRERVCDAFGRRSSHCRQVGASLSLAGHPASIRGN